MTTWPAVRQTTMARFDHCRLPSQQTLATPLGTAVLAQADTFLKLPLRETRGVNTDSHRLHPDFLLGGSQMGSGDLGSLAGKYPQSGAAKPGGRSVWQLLCAQGYAAADKTLPRAVCFGLGSGQPAASRQRDDSTSREAVR